MLPESALNQCANARRVYIGYSGGVDSHVLLHLCASIDSLRPKITAVYVHHGLQAVAESWAEHCAKIAEALGVEFLLLRVNASAMAGESPEEAARNARYTALKAIITVDDVLLVAQHREDQLETVLLQLFRGSGLRGLSGMPESMAFGQGILLRPLLDAGKSAITGYAEAHHLRWIEDPTNQANDYDRNFLRNAVMPLLKQRWPAVDKTVARSAKHCAEAQLLVSEVADELFLPVFNAVDNTVCIVKLKAYTNYRQQLVIRQWFEHLGLKMPSQGFVERILAEVVAAREDSDPVLSGQGYQIRRYRDKLYCLKHSAQETLKTVIWPMGQTSIMAPDKQQLSCVPASTGILRERWQSSHVAVKFRSGGETICLPGRQGHHALKKLFQEAGIPPWERPLMPLVYLDDKLAAIGDQWISAEFFNEKTDACVRLSVEKI
ncbi:MAG: tRNA lysidine(34) synthetase TilS [Methylococcaceae bacterium]